MAPLLTLLVVTTLAASDQDAPTAVRLEALAKHLKFFPTGEFVYGRSHSLDRRLSDNWTDPWYEVLKEISSPRHHEADLLALLKHKDPKVRTLALAALFQREDAKLLPRFAALMADKEETVPLLEIRRADIEFKRGDPMPQDFHPQTVGQVAKRFVEWWVRAAGMEAKDFDTYWAARKDRQYCASWFAARMLRATGGITPL